MKLSCLPVSYFPLIISGQMSVGDWAREAAALGLDGCDISILFVKQLNISYLASLRSQIDDAGIGLTMVTTYPDFTHPSAEQRQREIDQISIFIEASARLGARYVRVTSGQGHPQTPRQQGIEWAIHGLTQALSVARANKIILVFENHARPGVWQYPDFCYPPEIFLEIARRTWDSDLLINWDTANTIAYGDEPLPILRQVISRVATIHAADTRTRGALNHVLLGTGLVPFLATFRFLRHAGWDGWVCIEEGSKMGRAGVAEATRFVRNTWTKALP
jgi:sugar phosphate isomerase/epimerase